jgi:hypothetical protein
MNTVKKLSIATSLLMTFAIPALAGVTVTSPANGAQVATTFNLVAAAPVCSNQTVAAMGYSLDGSSDTTIVNSSSINASVASPTGGHTLHVKAWGNQGAPCDTDVAITVTTTTSPIPQGAISVSSIQTMNVWTAANDSGGQGSSSGAMAMVNSPSQSGNARRFATSFTNYGDERYSTAFGDDTTHLNFFYDGWVYIGNSASEIGNIEMDVNQVIANGQTVIFGFQCDGYSSTWDYTANVGTPTSPIDTWLHSGASCNPRNWSVNTWHHIQISFSRTAAGVVTYHTVWFDGAQETINATAASAFALNWAPTLLTNFQVDGLGSGGTSTVYLDNLTIYRW